jgi:hypothetical protein
LDVVDADLAQPFEDRPACDELGDRLFPMTWPMPLIDFTISRLTQQFITGGVTAGVVDYLN